MVGADGDIMLDCYMAFTQDYTVDLAQMVASYRPYWMEEVLQPHDYGGFGRIRNIIRPIRVATGEHEYTRYGFRQLLEHGSADIWQPVATRSITQVNGRVKKWKLWNAPRTSAGKFSRSYIRTDYLATKAGPFSQRSRQNRRSGWIG